MKKLRIIIYVITPKNNFNIIEHDQQCNKYNLYEIKNLPSFSLLFLHCWRLSVEVKEENLLTQLLNYNLHSYNIYANIDIVRN